MSVFNLNVSVRFTQYRCVRCGKFWADERPYLGCICGWCLNKEHQEHSFKMEKSNAALRGVITRMKAVKEPK